MSLVRVQSLPVALGSSVSSCLSVPKGEAFTYHILSAQDLMFLSDQDLEDTAILSLAVIML